MVPLLTRVIKKKDKGTDKNKKKKKLESAKEELHILQDFTNFLRELKIRDSVLFLS